MQPLRWPPLSPVSWCSYLVWSPPLGPARRNSFLRGRIRKMWRCVSLWLLSQVLFCSLDCSLWRQSSSLCLQAVCGEANVTELGNGSSEACETAPWGNLKVAFSHVKPWDYYPAPAHSLMEVSWVTLSQRPPAKPGFLTHRNCGVISICF